MYRYLVTRILLMIPTLFGAAVLVFAMMRLIPGDICVIRLGSGGTSFTPEALAGCHAELGLDQPVWRQFADFIWGLSRPRPVPRRTCRNAAATARSSTDPG